MLNAITNTAYGGQVPLTALALAAMQRNSAVVLAPLPGYTFSDAAGTTAATIDGVVGCVKDQLGGALAATNATAGQKYIWREGAVNLLTYSEDFTNAAWVKGSATVTANQGISPLGDNTADRVQLPSGQTPYQSKPNALTAAGKFTVSMYVKSNTGNSQTFRLFIYDTALRTSIDFTATAVWQRFEHTITSAGAQASNSCGITTAAGGGDNDLLIWGAQLETGSTASPYVATTDAPKSNQVGPYWLDSDLVDDKLITVAGAAYPAATVIKSIKGVGHITAHAQDISASTNWTDDNLCGLILSPAQPGAADLALMERYADYLAGVTP